MADFPTLTKEPSFPLPEEKEDTTIKSKSEAGYVQTRRRFTRERMSFAVKYEMLPNADKDAIGDHVDGVYGGVSSFNWTHPITGTAYVMRYDKRPKFEPVHYDGDQYLWNVDFVLNEV